MEELLEKIMNNLFLIEQYNQDYLEQNEKVVECNTKLILLKNELNLKEASDFEEFNLDITNKNLFQSQQEIATGFSTSESITNTNNYNNNSNKITRQEIDLLFKNDEMFENIRKHLIDYLK